MLTAFAAFVWTAEVSVVGGATSDVAESFFETGPITPADWHNASWLAAAVDRPNQYRFEFEVPAGGVGRARAYVASPGCASVLVNGQLPAVDLRGICPWVAGDEHANARYQTHDITAAVTSGKNAIGLVAGNVMTGSATAIAVVVVHPATDGADPIVVASGPGWQSRGKAYVTKGEVTHVHCGRNAHCPVHCKTTRKHTMTWPWHASVRVIFLCLVLPSRTDCGCCRLPCAAWGSSGMAGGHRLDSGRGRVGVARLCRCRLDPRGPDDQPPHAASRAAEPGVCRAQRGKTG